MAPQRVAVAYSGGRDSTALLHVTATLAAQAGLIVHALHVHHGLSPHADAWLQHCQQQCERWAAAGLPLEFHSHRLQSRPGQGESIEAWARDARHAALAEMAEVLGVSLILLAHHRRDQAETFVLQALRGAGMAGLSSMPVSAERSGLTWVRPWLKQGREAIDAYVQQHGLICIEDDSNSDPRYARNRLRLQVWPALLKAYPHAEGSLAQSAAWAQDALNLQREVAEADLLAVCDVTGDLRLADWLKLSLVRRGNTLRAWLLRESGKAAPASLNERLLRELGQDPTPAEWPHGSGWLRRYRGVLRFVPCDAPPMWPTQPEPLCIRRAGRYPLPAWGGVLQLDPVEAHEAPGLALKYLKKMEVRRRQGGEQFQRAPGSTPRSLKKCFQEAGVPEWAREVPLFYADERLVFVPGLGLDARVWAADDAAQLKLRWQPDPNAKA